MRLPTASSARPASGITATKQNAPSAATPPAAAYEEVLAGDERSRDEEERALEDADQQFERVHDLQLTVGEQRAAE